LRTPRCSHALSAAVSEGTNTRARKSTDGIASTALSRTDCIDKETLSQQKTHEPSSRLKVTVVVVTFFLSPLSLILAPSPADSKVSTETVLQPPVPSSGKGGKGGVINSGFTEPIVAAAAEVRLAAFLEVGERFPLPLATRVGDLLSSPVRCCSCCLSP
jgi:hypothetical protein